MPPMGTAAGLRNTLVSGRSAGEGVEGYYNFVLLVGTSPERGTDAGTTGERGGR